MSCFLKDPNALRCRSCERVFLLPVANFPDDLFQLLSIYDVPRIYWFCESCDRWKITQSDIVKVYARLSKVESDITYVKNRVREREEVVREREIDVGPRWWDDRDPNGNRLEPTSRDLFLRDIRKFFRASSDREIDEGPRPLYDDEPSVSSPNESNMTNTPSGRKRKIDEGSPVDDGRPNKAKSPFTSRDSSPVSRSSYARQEQGLDEGPKYMIEPYETRGQIIDVASPGKRSQGSSEQKDEPHETNTFRNSRDTSPRGRRSGSSSPSNYSPRSSSRSPPRAEKEANAILNNIIVNGIRIDKKEAQHSKEVITNFLDTLIPYLKSIDPVVKFMFRRDYRTGSSYNGLKISSADEYDVNIMFVMVPPFSLEVEFFKETKVFAKLKWDKIEEISDDSEKQKSTLKFLEKNSKDGYLDPLKIKAWFQGLLDKFCRDDHKIKLVEKIINSQSGPARTIKISTKFNGKMFQINLDLVPVFEFQFDDIFNKENRIQCLLEHPLEKSKQFCSLVPKNCAGEVQLRHDDCLLSWRLHVPELDKAVLHKKDCAKPLIRLLKLLRDQNDWQFLASYHLVTVILWDINENSNDWGMSYLYERFLRALELLQGYLDDCFLPYFLYPEHNLFHNLSQTQCKNLSNKIMKIITQLKSDHCKLKTVFKMLNQRN